MRDTIIRLVRDSISAKEALLKTEVPAIEKCANAIVKSLKSGGKLLVFGNGGSAADSQHIAAELVGRFKKERESFGAIALTTDTSIITALANDYSYDMIFARQIEALGKREDIALGISTSGNSKNVLAAIEKAKAIGMVTISLTGGTGGKLKDVTDISIVAQTLDTARAQECHITIAHIVCELVENEMTRP